MPDHRLGDEYETLRKTVEEFARDVVAPVIGDYYEREEFPYDIVRQMGEMGLFGLPFPEEYGGMGGDYFALCLAIEELAGSTRRWPSRWRRPCRWARCRSTASAPTSRRRVAAALCTGRCSARSG